MEIKSDDVLTKDGFMVFLKTYPYVPRTILGDIAVPQEPGIITSVDMFRYFFHVKDMSYYPYYKILIFHYQTAADSGHEKIICDAELENADKIFAKYGSVPQRPEDNYMSSGHDVDTTLDKMITKIEASGQDWLEISKADDFLLIMAKTNR